MDIIDKHARRYFMQYMKQCFIAIAVVVAILFFLDIARYTVIVASLGATTFVVFAIPHSYSATARRISGGYLVGVVVGISLYYTDTYLASLAFIDAEILNIIIGGTAVGASIFIMAITNTEHPPAAGLSMGLIFNPWSVEAMIIIFMAVFILCLFKQFLGKWLINMHGITGT